MNFAPHATTIENMQCVYSITKPYRKYPKTFPDGEGKNITTIL
jgi:hypothetical protein